MRALLQRVTAAQVTVDGTVVGEIGRGLLVLLGVAPDDRTDEADRLADKIARLRIFADEAGRMNRSVEQIGGEILLVSQFTLYADTSRGNRPGFSGAAPPERAAVLVEAVGERLRQRGLRVATGTFGAHMAVSLTNDGPVTILLDTRTS